MKTRLWKNISIPARTKNIKALTSRLLWAKTTPLMYAFMKYFTLDSGSLHSIPGKNVVNSHTLYFSILFYRPFFSAFRGPLSGDSPSLSLVFHSQFISIAFIRKSHLLDISTFTFFVYKYSTHEYFLIPDDAVVRRKPGFFILLFKQQFKSSWEQFYITNCACWNRLTPMGNTSWITCNTSFRVELIWFEFHWFKLIF